MRRQSLLSGALALTASGVAVKAIGWLYRVVLPRILGGGELGAYGVGVFGVAVTLYQFVGLATTYGVPIATSKTIAEQSVRGEGDAFFRRISDAVSTGALVVTVLIVLASPVVGVLYGATAGLGCLLIAPAVVLSARTGLFSGYFESGSYMVPHAVAQVTEQVARVAAILIIAALLSTVDVALAGGVATVGFTVGAAAGLVYLHRTGAKYGVSLPGLGGLVGRLRESRIAPGSARLKQYLKLVALVAVAGSVLPVLNLVDMWVVPLRADALALSDRSATVTFGIVTQMALPIVMAPTVVTSSLAVTTVPKVAQRDAADREGSSDHVILRSLALGTWLLVPAAVLLMHFGDEIARLFWDYARAGRAIEVLAWSIPFYGVFQIAAGGAQAKGNPRLPATSVGVACLVKAGADWYLMGIVEDPSVAVAVGTVAAFFVATVICMSAVFEWRDSVARWIRIQALRQALPLGFVVAAVWVHARFLAVGRLPLLTAGWLVSLVVGYVAFSLVCGTIKLRELVDVPLIGPVAERWHSQ